MMRFRYILLGAVMILAGWARAQTDTQQAAAQAIELSKASAAELLPPAEQGDAVAQYYLSQRYARGEGVEKDLVQAYMWALLAEDGGVSIFGSTAQLKTQMTDPQIADAQQQFKAFLAKTETRQSEPAEPDENQTAPIESGPLRFTAEIEPFAVDFPSMPKRVIVQDQPQIDAVYYLSRSADGKTQYSLSFQTFKNQPPQDNLAQVEFFHDYLSARAVVSVNRKVYRKFIRFRGHTAVRFKHTTLSEQTEMTHEGIVFLTDSAAISLTCVYPSQITPSPIFKEYTDSFKWIEKAPAR
jgi:hypothetical protein